VEVREPGPGTGDESDEPEPSIEPPVDDVPPESAEPEGRRYPSTLGGAFYLAVLATSAVGLGIVANGNWRLGVKWVAASLVFGAVVRLAVPAPQAGMLAVRRRPVDVVLLAAVGAVLWFLSTSIPNQPPL
jgi:Protein of unknown function (DUF3017)